MFTEIRSTTTGRLVNLNNNTDWLSSRRLVSDKWSRDLERLQARARKARDSMKKNRLERVLPERTYESEDKGIPYQDCVMIVTNLLKEDSSTNFLGQYKDVSLYAWDKIKRDYEKSGLCIAQIARDLISMCKYEIPSLREELEEMQKRAGHSEKSMQSLNQSLHLAAKELSASCEDIGIETNDVAGLNSESQIESRIMRSVNLDVLREELQAYRVAAREKSIRSACDLYVDFTKYIASSVISGDQNTSEDSTTKLLMSLRKIQNEDEPISLKSYCTKKIQDDEKQEENKDEDEVGGDIDWGIEFEEEEEEEDNGDDGGINNIEVASDAIDWGITMEDDDNNEIVVEDEGEEKNEKEDAATASLIDSSIRETLLDDIEELICFLTQRAHELEKTELQFLTRGGAKLEIPKSIQTQTLQGINNVLKDVTSLRDRLTSPDFRAKILIASSLSYRNRLAKQILSLRHRSVKLEGKKIQALDRRDAILSSISDLEPKVLRTVRVAKKLRNELETLISSSLNGRKVKIAGTRLR
jgi:hypothetical protein